MAVRRFMKFGCYVSFQFFSLEAYVNNSWILTRFIGLCSTCCNTQSFFYLEQLKRLHPESNDKLFRYINLQDIHSPVSYKHISYSPFIKLVKTFSTNTSHIVFVFKTCIYCKQNDYTKPHD